MDAFNGNWSRRGLIHIPVAPESPGRPPKPTVGEWTDTRLREAHRRFHNGSRDFLTLEGERVYQARRKRAQRAGAMSPVDRVWAEKNAVKSSWEMDTRANRRARLTNTTTE
jgi:hypothetical protein